MQITIDPTSLESTASVLRSVAEVLGELCPRVARAGDDVWAPPAVAAHLEAVAASAASTLHGVLYELVDEAADLERRAECCCAGEPTSLPVPALVGLAFGGAAISRGAQVQPASAVSAVAARGPGVAASAPVFSPAPAMAAPVAAPASAGPPSIYEALGSGTFGGGSPVGTGISMVHDPTVNSMAPALGISMVPSDNPPAVAGVGGIPLRPGSSMDAALNTWGWSVSNNQMMGMAMGTNVFAFPRNPLG